MVSVLMDVVTSMLLTSRHNTRLVGNSGGILNPLGHLAHGSAVVVCPAMVPPIVVRQRDSFRFSLANAIRQGLEPTVIVMSKRWHGKPTIIISDMATMLV